MVTKVRVWSEWRLNVIAQEAHVVLALNRLQGARITTVTLSLGSCLPYTGPQMKSLGKGLSGVLTKDILWAMAGLNVPASQR